MQNEENISLRPYNTFAIDTKARYVAKCGNVEDIVLALDFARTNHLQTSVLGGGSNVLLLSDINGLVIKPDIDGIETTNEDDDHVYLRVGAGVNWHRFVLHCVDNNLGGVENLSLIPGNCGASPMQNIGAYGVEIKDVFQNLKALHRHTGEVIIFDREDCEFGYRESVFKRKYRDEFIITHVSFRLSKTPRLNTSYGAIAKQLEQWQISSPTIKSVSDAVIAIRQSKLPDPARIGNAGSFFKNPVIPSSQHQKLKEQFPSLVSFDAGEGFVKLAAGWLIESCGWKGFRENDAGCYPLQALVLVNYGNAKGQEIYNLSARIIDSVKQKFGVVLEREVNLVSGEL